MLVLLISCSLGMSVSLEASSQPEKIRAGQSYYSDALGEPTNQGMVRAPGQDKNYEEVYQFYTYYEFVYDEEERVVLFREYKRGEVIRAEKYSYGDAGALKERVVSQPGKEDEVTLVEAIESKSPPE
jgi:hypothetical protein